MNKSVMIGKVAKCSEGVSGLVLQCIRVRQDSMNRFLYTGVCLDSGKMGQPWESFNPEWVGTLDDWVELRYPKIIESKRLAEIAREDMIANYDPL